MKKSKIIEASTFVDNTAGPQCEDCTHYQAEHDDNLGGHCKHVMYIVDEPGVSFQPKKYCPCKKFNGEK